MAYSVKTYRHINPCIILAVKEKYGSLTVLELELLEWSSICYFVNLILELQWNEPRIWRKAYEAGWFWIFGNEFDKGLVKSHQIWTTECYIIGNNKISNINIDFPQNLQRHHHTDEHDQLVLILCGSYHWMNMPLHSHVLNSKFASFLK